MMPRDGRITRGLVILFFAGVIAYGYFEGRGLIYGPDITVPSDTLEVTEPLVKITGHVDRINSLFMNGKQISVTESGDFSEPYALAPGYNRVTIDANDRYGKTSTKTITVVYMASSTPHIPSIHATSTAATTTPATSTSPRVE